jgi:hypothetical protein
LSYLPQALLYMASLEEPNQDMAEPAAEEDDGQSSSCSSEEEWWLQEAEDPAARNMVFLLTFSALLHTSEDEELLDPDTLTREKIRDAVLDAVANPSAEGDARGGRPRTRTLQAQKLVVAKERHSGRAKDHFHVALKLSNQSRFQPLKLALRQRGHLACHFSTSHTMRWSVLNYLVVPSSKKPAVDAEVLVWNTVIPFFH